MDDHILLKDKHKQAPQSTWETDEIQLKEFQKDVGQSTREAIMNIILKSRV